MFEIIIFVILILSIVLHEVAHGYAASWLGDPTARLAGRLSINPISHIDIMGSIIIPYLLYISNTHFLFGYAKPVPYNPYNLRSQKWGESIIAAAGPLTNLFLAIIFALIIRMADIFALSPAFIEMAESIVVINIFLSFFNAVPFPPLDGSKIIVPFLPKKLAFMYKTFVHKMENMGLIPLFLIVFMFMFIFGGSFFNVVSAVKTILVGF